MRTDRRWSEEDRIDKQTQETQTETQTQMTYDRGYQAGGTLSHSVKTCHHLSACFDRRLSTSMPKAGQVVMSGAKARRAPEAGHRWS